MRSIFGKNRTQLNGRKIKSVFRQYGSNTTKKEKIQQIPVLFKWLNQLKSLCNVGQYDITIPRYKRKKYRDKPKIYNVQRNVQFFNRSISSILCWILHGLNMLRTEYYLTYDFMDMAYSIHTLWLTVIDRTELAKA